MGQPLEDIDIEDILDVLLLDLLVHVVAVNDLLVDSEDVLLGECLLLILLDEVVAVELDVDGHMVTLVLIVVVLLLDVFVVVLEVELPPFRLVDVESEASGVDRGEVGLDYLG